MRSYLRSDKWVFCPDTFFAIVPVLEAFRGDACVERRNPTTHHHGHRRMPENVEHHAYVYMSQATAVDAVAGPSENHNEDEVPTVQIRQNIRHKNPWEQPDRVVLAFFFASNAGSFDSFHVLVR